MGWRIIAGGAAPIAAAVFRYDAAMANRLTMIVTRTGDDGTTGAAEPIWQPAREDEPK